MHGGILARRDLPLHMDTLDQYGLPPIDLVVVNLYPFEATLASGADFDACIEQIDVGGPAMIRAAAKNCDGVAVLVEPGDYAPLLAEFAAKGGTDGALRRRLAAKAFARTAAYDAAISTWFAREIGEEFPERVVLAGSRKQLLRYGENPHQRAAFYATGAAPGGLAAAPSCRARSCRSTTSTTPIPRWRWWPSSPQPAVAIIKHANPCGVAVGGSLVEAYRKALACDPLSAFGGIVACNRPLDAAAASEMAQIFTEVVVAPGIDAGGAGRVRGQAQPAPAQRRCLARPGDGRA